MSQLTSQLPVQSPNYRLEFYEVVSPSSTRYRIVRLADNKSKAISAKLARQLLHIFNSETVRTRPHYVTGTPEEYLPRFDCSIALEVMPA